MRKNTLLKLLAVLAMCFLIGAALVSCGENETEDADVKAIVSVEIQNGKLIFAYSDGTLGSVELPDGEGEACAHQHLVPLVWQEHAFKGYDDEGKATYSEDQILNVCNDCHEAWVTYELKHIWISGTVTVEPTCTTEGYTTEQYCTVCNAASEKVNIVPATDHTWGEWEYVSKVDGGCVAGTMERHCANEAICGVDPETKDIAENANEGLDGIHTVTNWTKADAKTDAYAHGQEVFISGKCDVCHKDVNNVSLGKLPETKMTDANGFAFDKDASTLVIHCGDAAEYVYKYAVSDTLTFVYNVPVAANTAHGLMNKDGKFTVLETAIVGKPGDSKIYSVIDYPNIQELIEGDIDSCSEPELAYYECEHVNDEGKKCGTYVDIYAITGHNFVDAPVNHTNTPAGCDSDGLEWKKCHSCDEEQSTVVPATGHDYAYAYDYEDLQKDGDKYFYIGVCRNGCGIDDKVEVKLTTEVVEPTCEKPGYTKISYTPAHKGYAGGVIELVINPEPKIGHAVLVGDVVVELERGTADGSGKVYYYDDLVDAEGNHLVETFDDEVVGEKTLGYFVCYHNQHNGGASFVTIWVSTNEDYKVNTPDALK